MVLSSLTPEENSDCRIRIIEAATQAFREEGYRASIERIAQLAGVARQTLYNHFAGKDALFAEMTRRCSADIQMTLERDAGAVGDVAQLAAALRRFGMTLRLRLLGTEGLAAFRALLGEAQRFPDLARAFFENGPAGTHALLAALLERAMRAQLLRRDDPLFAAEMLIGMLIGIERTRLLCGIGRLDSAGEAVRVARIIDCFLAAYAASPAPSAALANVMPTAPGA